MFKYRIISFPLLLALVGAVFFWKSGGPYLFALIAVSGCGAALYEGGVLFDKIGIRNSPLYCAILGALISGAYCLDEFKLFESSYGAVAILLVLLCSGVYSLLVMISKKNEIVQKMAGSAGVIAILGVPFFLLESVYFRTLGNIPLLFYVICVAKSMDTGGYIFGMTTARLLPGGNHKIAPKISPNKSWEGVAGGMLMSVGVSLIFRHFCGGGMGIYILHGVILSLLSLAGDLTESSLKRSAGVKDSANWIPGMGGIFDVFDSFLYVGYFMLFSNLGR